MTDSVIAETVACKDMFRLYQSTPMGFVLEISLLLYWKILELAPRRVGAQAKCKVKKQSIIFLSGTGFSSTYGK